MDAKVTDAFERLSGGNEHDNFLLHEGLDVLAAYKSIGDDAVRLAVKRLIEALAATRRSSMELGPPK